MKTKAVKGKFKPNYPAKYSGNHKKIIYRSLWERRFMLYCDRSYQVKSWVSEEIEIPYYDTEREKWRTYYPDFLIRTSDNRTILVEIKPKYQWGWQNNKDKWNAAIDFCDRKGYTFKVLGQLELYGRGFKNS